MRTLDQLIQEHPFWEGLNREHLPLLSACASQMRFDAQEQIFEENAEAARFYLIESGRVALETYIPGKGPIRIQTIGAGEALGWSWLYPPYCWHFTARSLEPTETVVFDARRLRELAETNCGFGFQLAMRVGEIMLHRLQATRMQLLDFYGGQ